MRVLLAAFLVAATPALADATTDRIMAQFADKTGLKPITIPGTDGAYMGKTHRGYEVIYTAKAGDVWGRYAARLTMAELGRESGGLLAHLTGQRQHIGTVAGSPLDRLLSQQIRDHGDYWRMLNGLMDDLADIADAVPKAN